MKAIITQEQGLRFRGTAREHSFLMDTGKVLGGTDQGPTPKELLLASIIGCSGMDVAALSKKYKQNIEKLEISAEANTTQTHPKVFETVEVIFDATGKDLDPSKIVESVQLSMTKYCGVSAMLSKACPIYYTVRVNGEIQTRGQAFSS